MISSAKAQAINLRNSGYSYSEIQKYIPVSRATLSRWLSKISLSDEQKERLKVKMKQSISRAHVKNREKRIQKTKFIEEKAQLEIKHIGKNELLLIGTILYWAEGARQKEYDVSQGICFSNSDPLMIKLFVYFIRQCFGATSESIDFDIYIHEGHNNKEAKDRIITYWANVTGFSKGKFDKIYFKKDKPLGNRKKKDQNYFGLIRVKIKKSTDLNRKINGWIKGISIQCGIV